MSSTVKDKTVVITGGSRGIGLAAARRFLAEGARVAICGRDDARLARAVDSLGATSERVLSQVCDVASVAEVDRFCDALLARFGAVDVLVNNAGVVARVPLVEMEELEWDSVIDVNLKAAYAMSRRLLPAMLSRKSGRIINVSSISGTLGTPRLTAYCAAKHGLIGLTRALAEEVRDAGVQVVAICPGSVDTAMLQGSGFAPRMTADEIAGVIYYLACEAPPSITGSAVEVFG